MTLNLLKRAEKGSALNATEHDANLTAIENEVNAKANTAALGTSASLNVPASGAAAAAGEVVKGDDPRLSDARPPTAHTHVLGDLPGNVETTAGAQAKADAAQAAAIAAAASDATTKANAAAASSVPLAQKGAANGVATLDGTGKVPSAQLPGFVDDVIEAANAAALPATGSAGILYVTLDNNRTWRWSGSAYVEISPSPGSTDAVPEGSVNQYHTATRVRAVLLAGIDTATAGAVTAADSILSAIGKLVALVAGKVDTSDARLSDNREWTAATIGQAEAEAGTASTRRAWTAERVRQAIAAWWAATASSLLKTINGQSILGSGDLTVSGGGGTPGGSSGQHQFNSSGALAGSNLWEGTNAIDQRNGAIPQRFSSYNGYTDVSNWERGGLRWSTNEFWIGTEAAGSGVLRVPVIGIGSAYLISFGGSGGTSRVRLWNMANTATVDFYQSRSGAAVASIESGQPTIRLGPQDGAFGHDFRADGSYEMTEVGSDPAAPAANKARFFCRDNGSGKTQVCVRFPTGSVQVIATEP